MDTHTQEHGFEVFSEEEVGVGYDYAIDKCKVRLGWTLIRSVGNDAGAIRKASLGSKEPKTPRMAATEAIRRYERAHQTRLEVGRFNALVRTVAKMLSERNPKTRQAREREREVADYKAAVG